MANEIIIKICRVCKETKSLSEFYKEPKCKDGHLKKCKKCYLKQTKKYERTEKGKAVHKNYRQTEKGKEVFRKAIFRHHRTEKFKATQKRYITRYPERCKARDAVNYAVQAGNLPRPNTLQCHYCDVQAEQYHHHLGYESKHYLDVVPICQKCHNKFRIKTA